MSRPRTLPARCSLVVAALSAVLAAGGCENAVVDDDGNVVEFETDEIVNPSGEEQALSMPGCGTVLQTFDGVSAKSNGSNTGTGVGCAGVGGPANGLQYQCVELVMRYFKLKYNLRWYGNAKTLLDGAPRDTVDVRLNGDAAHPPVPGDLIVWKNGAYGHTALVTAVGRTYVDVIEQNVRSDGKARLPYDGATIGSRWSGWVPAGWAHAKANRRTPSWTPGSSTSPSSPPSSDSTDAAGCAQLAATGGVIDDDNACFTPGGTASYLHASTEGYANSLVWTHTTSSGSADNFGRWQLRPSRAGTYRVDVYTDTTVAQSRQARYRIAHNGTTDDVVLDQTARNGFRALGTFAFGASGTQTVRVDDNTGEAGSLRRALVFDALRLVPATAQLRVETGGATLNVRASPSTSAALLGQLSGGAVVTRLDTTDGTAVDGDTIWHKVQQGALVGWSAGRYLGVP